MTRQATYAGENGDDMKRILELLMLGCLFATGCASVMRFAGDTDSDCIFYESTRGDLGGIRNIINPPPSIDNGYLLVPKGLRWFILPFPIVDLPFAVALDTVLLPYDAYRYRVDKEEVDQRAAAYLFWGEAFQTDTIKAEEASRYFTAGTHDQIFLELRDGHVKTNVLNVVFDLSMAQNKTKLLAVLSAHGGLSQDQCRTLYAWQLAGGDSQTQYNLARNPATPMDMLTLFAASPDELLCRAVAEGGHLPWPKLREALAKSKPEWHRQSLRLAAGPATAPDTLIALAHCKFYDGGSIQAAVAANRSTPKDGLQLLAGSPFAEVRGAVAANPVTPAAVLRSLSQDREESVRAAAARNLLKP